MTLLIKNGGYAFLIRLDLYFLFHYGKSSNYNLMVLRRSLLQTDKVSLLETTF